MKKNIERMTPAYIWNKIKAYCNLNEIKRSELAGIVGKSEATISGYSKSPQNVTLDVIYRFCNACGIESLGELESI